nr:hypothetical protein [Tanacetum cinerariifolium]
MIGCKVMRTLGSAEIEIMSILGLPCCLSRSSVRCLETAYLDGTDTESKPFKDPIDTEPPESPLTVAPPTSLPESTLPTLVPILYRTAHMAVRVPPTMSSGLSVSMAEIEESLDTGSVSEDAKDKGPTAEDEDPAAGMRILLTFEVRQGSGSAPESERPKRVSASRQPTLITWTDPKDGMVYIDVPAYPPLAPPERTAVTFKALWRPVLALEAWAGRVDTRMADMSRAGKFGNAKPDRLVATSRTGSFPDES